MRLPRKKGSVQPPVVSTCLLSEGWKANLVSSLGGCAAQKCDGGAIQAQGKWVSTSQKWKLIAGNRNRSPLVNWVIALVTPVCTCKLHACGR